MKRSNRRTACLLLLAVIAILALAAKAEIDSGFLIGQYRAAKRELADYRMATSRPAIQCPTKAFVILALGQSNAANHVASPVGANRNVSAYSFFRGRCSWLADPIPGGTGVDGSLWTLLAQRLAQEYATPIVVISAAAAGSSVEDWRLDHANILSRALRSIAEAHDNNLRVDLVVWLQGEADAQNTGRARYGTTLAEIIDRISRAAQDTSTQADTSRAPPSWIVFRATRCSGAPSEAVRNAQLDVTLGNSPIYAGPDTDVLDNSYRIDGCHFNAAGRARIVDELLTKIRNLSLVSPRR